MCIVPGLVSSLLEEKEKTAGAAMAAKLLHTLSDDNPDLQKQIGCMTGIFQIFDRHHILSARRLSGQSHRRFLPPGDSHFTSSSLDVDSSNVCNQEATERNTNKYLHDRRLFTESSRPSFSSSSQSSSLSSLDCVRSSQLEPSALDRIIFTDTPPGDPVLTQPNASPRLGRYSQNLRDVVKDSMFRESPGLSNEANFKEQGASRTGKEESSKPLQLSRPVDGSTAIGMHVKHGLPDLKESLIVLAKLREAPRCYKEIEATESLYELKDGSVPRDGPRFSYDGREVGRLPQKVKDFPRLSLHSRESTVWGSNCDSKSASFSRNVQRDDHGSKGSISSPNKSSAQTRAAGVVAKLMGLEAFPDVAPSTQKQLGPIKTFSTEDGGGCSSISSKSADVCLTTQLPTFSRASNKEPGLPRLKNHDVFMKPVTSSKFPIEPAPWKHVDGLHGSLKQGLKQVKSPSVYCELEERLKDLEFKQSGKDLRALKQIIEAMQIKGLLETTKEASTMIMETRRGDERRIKVSDVNLRSTLEQELYDNHVTAPRLKQNVSPTAFNSPIVVMKPSKHAQNCGTSASSVSNRYRLPDHRPNNIDVMGQGSTSASRQSAMDQNAKDIHRDCDGSSSGRKTIRGNSAMAQTLIPPLSKDNTTSSVGLGSTSLRLLQRKQEHDKRPRRPTPELSKRSQTSSQPSDLGSPGGRRRAKSSNLQMNDDQSSERSSNSRNLSCHGDDMSLQTDNHSTVESNLEEEVTSSEQPMQLTGCLNPSSEASKFSVSYQVQGSYERLSKDNLARDCTTGARENTVPSPVSVLDASGYREDSPSPVKQVMQDLQDREITMCYENLVELPMKSVEEKTSNGRYPVLSSEMSRRKLQSIDTLVQKLRRLNSTYDEARTDYIASLCENSNPDHRYVSEILLASGLLLRDFSSGRGVFQLHPSGHPINPELFSVLEQTKVNGSTTNPDKIRRKLIFDTVNEILARKFASAMLPPEPWFKGNKLSWKTVNAQKLLRELCAEIDQLQPQELNSSLSEEEDDDPDQGKREEDGLKGMLSGDVMHRLGDWMDFYGDIPVVVLDVERSIFKDLVDEIVTGEAAAGTAGRYK